MNAAAEAALRHLGATTEAPPIEPAAPRRPSPPRRRGGGWVGRDHPSFTIEALPAEAYEALLIVANVLGAVVDDDPPYRLEAELAEEPTAWCRLDIAPDGGGSTVSLTVASSEGATVNEVRDRLVVELNRLDWSDDGPRPPLPS